METIYTFFKYDKEVIDIAFEACTNKALKANFMKKWGPKLDGKDKKYIYSSIDQTCFLRFKMEFENSLSLIDKLIKKGKNKEEIIKILKSNKTNNIKIIENRSTNKIKYYKVKSPEELEKIFNMSLEEIASYIDNLSSNNERLCFEYYYGIGRKKLNIDDICLILSGHPSKNLIESYLNKTTEFLLNICKTEKAKQDKEKEENKINSELEELIKQFPILKSSNSIELNIINEYYINNKKIDEISEELNIEIKKIDSILIKYLQCFKEKKLDILKDILYRGNYSTKDIIENTFLKNEFRKLSYLEIVYAYLILESYHNEKLTNDMINQIINIEQNEIKNLNSQTLSYILKK